MRIITMNRLAITFLVAAAATAYAATPQTSNPFLGTWKLDPDRSTFNPPPGPTNRTMTFEMKGHALHHLTSTINANGGTATIDYTAGFDGKDAPVEGAAVDTVELKQLDPHTIERTGKVRGMPSETCTMQVSPDGKKLTMTVKGKYNGTNYASTQIYTRQ